MTDDGERIRALEVLLGEFKRQHEREMKEIKQGVHKNGERLTAIEKRWLRVGGAWFVLACIGGFLLTHWTTVKTFFLSTPR